MGSEKSVKLSNVYATGTYIALACDTICPSPYNKNLNRDRNIDELASNIKANGQLNPIIVRGGGAGIKYELVCGERRWLACQKLKQPVAAFVRDLTDNEAMDIIFSENAQREDMTDIESAQYIKMMLDAGRSAESIADKMSKSIQWVSRRARLVDLSDKWLVAISKKESGFSVWGAGHLELVARFEKSVQNLMLDELENRYDSAVMSVKKLEEYTKEYTHVISSAPWKYDDVTMPGGACRDCQKRTGHQMNLNLFTTLKNEASERCLDPECWKKSMAEAITRKEKDLKEQKAEYVRLDMGDGMFQYNDDIKKGALGRWNITVCKKTDKGAVLALIVDGPGAGTVKYIKKPESVQDTGSGRQSGPKTMKEREAALEKRRNIAFISAVCVILETEKKSPDLISKSASEKPTDVLEFIIAFGAASDHDGYANGNTKMQKAVKRIAEKRDDVIVHAAIAMIPKWLSDLRSAINSTPGNDDINFAGSILDWIGIDKQKMLDQAIADIPEPKSWERLREEEKLAKKSSDKQKDKPASAKSKAKKVAKKS